MSAIDNIPKEQFTEFAGFTVYDAENGDPVDEEDVFPDEAVLKGFFLSEDGELLIDGVCGGEMFDVPKDGKYIVQFADGKYMRW